ncbi:hypothetical protein P4S72_25685 [Vibrio sp. PP-XX7]
MPEMMSRLLWQLVVLPVLKEEVHYVVTHFLERGMAVFNFDGPGQENHSTSMVCAWKLNQSMPMG